MRVVGTAGHVDHGKSTLIRALTGIDPDRLAEEKSREMTIDLGFAWMTLPMGEKVGFVDVPGHRDFIANMLAGIGSIDAVLLVIAADEGVMPQTREHVAILNLLGVEHGLVVLTKTDMVDDPDWCDLVEQDIKSVLSDTLLQGAEVVRVSARVGVGMDGLVEKLAELLKSMPARIEDQRPWLAIDRIFSVSGFGTVVTGTLLGGRLRVGDEIEIQPTGLRGRIRGLQNYLESKEVAEPGSRVAVNITGIEKATIIRGHVLTHPGQVTPTQLVDARFRYLTDAGRPLRHNAEIKFYSGTAQSGGYVRLLANDELQPGEEGWIQIRLTEPLALGQKDRFILRFPSPSKTIGGGEIVDPLSSRRWKRFQPGVIQRLQTRMQGTSTERVIEAANSVEPMKRSVLQKNANLSDLEFSQSLDEALRNHLLVRFPGDLFQAVTAFQTIIHRMVDELDEFHKANPLRLGMRREELRNRVSLSMPAFNLLLNEQHDIISENDLVRKFDHSIRFNDKEQKLIEDLMSKMTVTPYAPPSFSEVSQIVGQELLYTLIDLGEIVQTQAEVILSKDAYREMVRVAFQIIDERGSVAANELRDHFGTTRKYAIALLEYLDTIGLTRRKGDVRVRGTRSLQG